MKDVTGAIRTAVVSKLRNNITLDGSAVKIYARVAPVGNSGNYIYIPRQSSTNDSSKQYFSTEHSMDIEVVHRSEDGTYVNPLEVMVNQVMQILDVKFQKDMPQPIGFGLVDFVFVRRNELIDYDGTYTIMRVVLTFEAIIDEG